MTFREIENDIVDKLQPCPFCGKRIELVDVETDRLGFAYLKIMCCTNMSIFGTMNELESCELSNRIIERWNTRV